MSSLSCKSVPRPHGPIDRHLRQPVRRVRHQQLLLLQRGGRGRAHLLVRGAGRQRQRPGAQLLAGDVRFKVINLYILINSYNYCLFKDELKENLEPKP